MKSASESRPVTASQGVPCTPWSRRAAEAKRRDPFEGRFAAVVYDGMLKGTVGYIDDCIDWVAEETSHLVTWRSIEPLTRRNEDWALAVDKATRLHGGLAAVDGPWRHFPSLAEWEALRDPEGHARAMARCCLHTAAVIRTTSDIWPGCWHADHARALADAGTWRARA